MRPALGLSACVLSATLFAAPALGQGAPPAQQPAPPVPGQPVPPPDQPGVPPAPLPGPAQPSPPPQPGQPGAQPAPQQPGQPVPVPQPGPYPQQPYPQQPNQQPNPQQPQQGDAWLQGQQGQYPQAYPQQPYPQQPYSQQPYSQQPGYGPAPPAQPYGPGYGPPPPPAPPKDTCCRFALRFDPFNLLFRRLSFQGEVAIVGPLSVEVEPSWIFGSGADNVDAKGFAIAGNVAFYLTGKAPQGFFIKAHAAYETFKAIVSNPGYSKSLGTGQIGSPIFGGMIGSSTVFGRNWGFNISGGIGIGVATAGSQTVVAPGKGSIPAYAVSFYDKGSSIQLLGSLGLGIGF